MGKLDSNLYSPGTTEIPLVQAPPGELKEDADRLKQVGVLVQEPSCSIKSA